MIEFKIQLTETKIDGKRPAVNLHCESPASPSATAAEIAVAKKLDKKVRQWIRSTDAAKIELPPETRRIVLPRGRN